MVKMTEMKTVSVYLCFLFVGCEEQSESNLEEVHHPSADFLLQRP